MPLATGYAKKTISSNIKLLLSEGTPLAHAIVKSMNLARKSYFRAYPNAMLPASLAYPKDHRLAHHYAANGAPFAETVSRETNPVRELDIDPDELEQIRRNVQKQMSGQGKAIRKAAALYTDFTGHDDPRLTKVSVPDYPTEAVAIGQVDGIMYSTVRDGVPEKYIHKFKRSSRPLMISSPDGKQLYLIGGSYDFTERGIVDS